MAKRTTVLGEQTRRQQGDAVPGEIAVGRGKRGACRGANGRKAKGLRKTRRLRLMRTDASFLRRPYDRFDLRGASDVPAIDLTSNGYWLTDIEGFAASVLDDLDALIAAGALDAGNGAVLDRRIDDEMAHELARLAGQHARVQEAIARLESSLRGQLVEVEARIADVKARMGEGGAACAGAGGPAAADPDGEPSARPAARPVVIKAPAADGDAGDAVAL